MAAFSRDGSEANRNAVIVPGGLVAALTSAPQRGQPEFSTPMAGLHVETRSFHSSCKVRCFRRPPCPVT